MLQQLKHHIPRGLKTFVRDFPRPIAVPAVLRSRRSRRSRSGDPQLAVFVSDRPRGREAKLGHALRRAGWRVVLLHGNEPNFDLTPYFDSVHRFSSPWHALHLASGYTPRVFHLFSMIADNTAYVLCRHKPGPVVFDTNDLFENTIDDPVGQEWVPKQRFCIEHADAMCCRDLQSQYMKKKLGYNRPHESILFPEYCWNAPTGDSDAERKQDQIHVVLCGNFGIEKRGDTDSGCLDVARKLTDQRIHFHIYLHWFWANMPKDEFEEVFSDYLELERETSYFHLHPSIPMDQLIDELRKYDIGINMIRALTFGETPRKYSMDHYYYCGSSRNFDYLDAGLPVIVNRELSFQYFMLARHGMAIEATREVLSNARQHFARVLTPEAKARARKGREQDSLDRQVGRLIDFYERVGGNR